MDYRNYDYVINIVQVIPPIGGLKFSGNISFLAKRGPDKATRLSPDIGEALGETKEEAYAKFEVKLRKWIDSQK
jgi:hypothetical protein